VRGPRDAGPQAYLQSRNPGFIFAKRYTKGAVRDVAHVERSDADVRRADLRRCAAVDPASSHGRGPRFDPLCVHQMCQWVRDKHLSRRSARSCQPTSFEGSKLSVLSPGTLPDDRNWRGLIPVHRLNACVKEPISRYPRSHAISEIYNS